MNIRELAIIFKEYVDGNRKIIEKLVEIIQILEKERD